MITAPEFMNNKEWYTYDPETDTYALTDKAPEWVKPSFDEWVKHRHDPYGFYGDYTEEEFAILSKKEAKLMHKLLKGK